MKSDNMPQVARYWNDIAHDFDAFYTGQKGAVARALDHVLRKDFYDRFDWVMEKAGDIRGKTVCDIGCGPGRYVTAFAQRGVAHVTGVDVAPEMLKMARDLVRADGVAERCSFVQADVLNWETDEQFDLTIAIGVWDYIGEPLSRLRVIRRMTRDRFLSVWPRLWTWRTPIRKARLTAAGCPVYFYRRGEVTRLLEEAGFRPGPLQVVGKQYRVEAHPA
jgi:ubiquinone/menaquinone biosynthesis C-methylase UbiE